jgi:hypothetical protein
LARRCGEPSPPYDNVVPELLLARQRRADVVVAAGVEVVPAFGL